MAGSVCRCLCPEGVHMAERGRSKEGRQIRDPAIFQPKLERSIITGENWGKSKLCSFLFLLQIREMLHKIVMTVGRHI